MMRKARIAPLPIEASAVFANTGSKMAANAGSATIPTAMLEAVIPTWHVVRYNSRSSVISPRPLEFGVPADELLFGELPCASVRTR